MSPGFFTEFAKYQRAPFSFPRLTDNPACTCAARTRAFRSASSGIQPDGNELVWEARRLALIAYNEEKAPDPLSRLIVYSPFHG